MEEEREPPLKIPKKVEKKSSAKFTDEFASELHKNVNKGFKYLLMVIDRAGPTPRAPGQCPGRPCTFWQTGAPRKHGLRPTGAQIIYFSNLLYFLQ